MTYEAWQVVVEAHEGVPEGCAVLVDPVTREPLAAILDVALVDTAGGVVTGMEFNRWPDSGLSTAGEPWSNVGPGPLPPELEAVARGVAPRVFVTQGRPTHARRAGEVKPEVVLAVRPVKVWRDGEGTHSAAVGAWCSEEEAHAFVSRALALFRCSTGARSLSP